MSEVTKVEADVKTDAKAVEVKAEGFFAKVKAFFSSPLSHLITVPGGAIAVHFLEKLI